jgi:uncharacterized protein with FMN-binding domain
VVTDSRGQIPGRPTQAAAISSEVPRPATSGPLDGADEEEMTDPDDHPADVLLEQVVVPTVEPVEPGVTVFDGSVSDTQFGPVQVQIRVRDGRIVSVFATQFPQDILASKAVNAFAVPILQEDTLRVQSAEIDTVSGATDTSEGYRLSLQAALDAAHL